MARPKTGPRGVTLSTYLPPADAERLRRLAEAADRPLAREIKRAIDAHLRATDNGDAR